MTDVVLLGGPKSGKSTVVGGLVKYLTINSSGKNGYYNVIREHDTNFEEDVLDKMENFEYPSRTVQHVVEVNIKDNNSIFFPQDQVMTVFDFGGEYQTEMFMTDDGFIDLSEDNSDIIFDDIDILREKVNDCKGIIFLMNLNKIFADNIDNNLSSGGFISPSTLESELVKKKDKNALVITATDLINYFPDDHKKSLKTTTFNDEIYDDELFTRLNNRFQSSRITATLRMVKNRDNFDLFGVSVPPGEEEGTLAKRDGTFQTEGFETLIRWILK